jgi:predicted nucleic acid-binding protein
MSFVLDASITMAWCFADESTLYTRSVLATLLGTYAEVPSLWTFEIANVLAVCERKRRITSAFSEDFLRTLADFDIRVEQAPPVNANALLTLARRYNLTAYDAAYLELARRKSLPLATLDKDLIAAASQEGVVLLSQP